MESTIRKIFKEIFDELNIKCTVLSKDWIFMLEKDNKTRFLAGYKSSLNDHALGSVVDDKYALFDVLKAKGIPVAEYNIVYGENNTNDYAIGCNSFDCVKDYFLSHNKEIVMKPNNGTCGHDVYKINDINKLMNIYYKLTKRYFSINVGPFYHIKNEYRFVVLNDEIRIAYKKNKPVVYGDGKKTIRELLCDFNYHFFKDRLNNEKFDQVLKKGEEFEYNWKFNLSQGSIASPIDDKELYNSLSKLALDTAKEIGLKFGSVDIIYTEDNEALILEMNSGVMVDNYLEQFKDKYDEVKAIYREVIEEMFRN